MQDRILLFALRGRDAIVIEQLLAKQGHRSIACANPAALAHGLAEGAGTAVVTEESFVGADSSEIEAWLDAQAPWSDFPFILLATKRAGSRPREAMRLLQRLGNVVVLERPIHSDTLTSAVTSALRVRRRQYEARAQLQELQAAEDRLTQLNATLETRIAERTAELSRANNELMREVAERERAQAALVQSQKMEAVGQLTGGIAHDFNNLLTVVSGNLELIGRLAKDSRIARYARFASSASERAAKLTQQLLAFSRTQQLALTPIDINALIAGMDDLLHRTIGPQIETRRVTDPQTPWVSADFQQLELAVLNLAINARDAMPEGGVLTIETDADAVPPAGLAPGRYGVIRVRDTGSGISPELLTRVFDPFFTTKPLGKGTGLGLSQVFGIAQQSGGLAQIESEEGVGTTVSIWLPRTEPPAADGRDESAGEAAPADVHRRVLVIDDDDGVRRFMVESLALFGYATVEASNGEDGLALMRREMPDLLIVDYAMPGRNGVEVALEARAMAPDMPIVLATGYADTDAAARANVIAQVLRKPFGIEELAQAIESAAGGVDQPQAKARASR
ncbi:ATP-binding protein [Sphingomonas sp. M1-B02]|uniref:ATP-binding protein n=1 Tax=Sphingomonas sp. M1-B02 TaxID=3114300 RepID=UPI00223F3497|nr:ATP-binding protein [Sphingomonas sp. S6-11]UZK64954.1 response regulator [Sphingomonas sp. S6-11]